MEVASNEQALYELEKRLHHCGLSSMQVTSYIDFFRYKFQNVGQNISDYLPAEKNLTTLQEALRIKNAVSTEDVYSQFGEYEIHRFLQVSSDEWIGTKQTIATLFDRDLKEIDEVYNKDEAWLFVTSGDVSTLAAFLKSTFNDDGIIWKIFQKAALLGTEQTKERVIRLFDLLGEEIGKQVISYDIAHDGWLFYRFYTDPIGCIDYMKECGLTPEKIMNLIEQDSYILYLFKEGRRPRYNHNQEGIDLIIQKYI